MGLLLILRNKPKILKLPYVGRGFGGWVFFEVDFTILEGNPVRGGGDKVAEVMGH